jgi:DNA-binding protein H-NS
MDILQKAHKIVYERSEEKEREYGPFIEGMIEAAKIASLLSRKDITTEDIYNCMIALKLSREAYSHKEDNLLDAVAYMSSMNDFKNRKNK